MTRVVRPIAELVQDVGQLGYHWKTNDEVRP